MHRTQVVRGLIIDPDGDPGQAGSTEGGSYNRKGYDYGLGK